MTCAEYIAKQRYGDRQRSRYRGLQAALPWGKQSRWPSRPALTGDERVFSPLEVTMLESWQQWRAGVVAQIRCDFREVLDDVQDADIDWDAWRPLYEEGRSPRAAVDRAFLREV